MAETVRFGELVGRLHRPEGATACIVLGHGFSATVTAGLERYCERFAAAGFAALAFDYRGFGASGGVPRDVLSVREQLIDWERAVAFARGLEGISQVAVWGTSYGGGHVLEVGARDPSLAAVVAQVPHVSGPATLRTMRFWVSCAALALGWADRVGARLGLPPLYLPVRGLEPLYADPANAEPHRVAARAYAELRSYVPGQAAARIASPLLVQVALEDEITPAATAAAVARSAPHGELITYSGRHFDVYLRHFDTATADAIAFLCQHLRTAHP